MLLGIWGPFACGKTTFLNAYMCRHASADYAHVSFVFADLSVEYHWKGKRWADVTRKGDDDHWKGKQDCKESFIDSMVADDRRIWVVESARYFSGMYECLVSTFQRYDGGMAFIIPVTDGPTMKIFMQERCAGRGKEFREDYWEPKRVAYEAGPRYTNAAEKWFLPNHIPYEAMTIERDRKNFSIVGNALDYWLKRPASKWYDVSKRYQEDMDRVDGRRARQ